MSRMNLNLQVERPLVLAWGVHLFTATGALWGLLAIMATVQHQWQAAFFWLALAALVDSLDGTLARRHFGAAARWAIIGVFEAHREP